MSRSRLADRWSSNGRGVTLPELLVVVSIIALAVTVSVPLISEAVRSAKIRAAADQFAMTIRAVRMIAVSTQQTVTLQIDVTGDAYSYVDSNGKMRNLRMPAGVRIVSATPPAILFRSDGSVPGGATTKLEALRSRGAVEIWEIETNMLGVSTVTHSVQQ